MSDNAQNKPEEEHNLKEDIVHVLQEAGDVVDEVVHPDSAHWKIIIFEFLGTLIFAHGINAAGGNESDFYVAISLFCALIISCKFSGGHINPAVSTAFFCLDTEDKPHGKAINTGRLVTYVLSQLAGAFCGAWMSLFILGEDSTSAPFVPRQELNWMIADTLGEFLGTFTFVLVILIMTDRRTQYNNQTIYILMTIAAALYFSRQFTDRSGGCLNPAIALGMELMMTQYTGDGKWLRRSYVYIIGPLCGAVAGGLFFRHVYLPRKIQVDEDAKKPYVAPVVEEKPAEDKKEDDKKQE